MLSVLSTITIAFIITLIAIPAIIRVADEKNLYDLPDARKLHNRPIASLGGIGIFIGFILSVLISTPLKENNELRFFFASAIVIFFLGLKDDILILSARKKFLGQLAAAALIIHLGHVQLHSMHGLFGIGNLPDYISIPLTYITIIVIVNAFNLIDGIDGLAGSLGILSLGVLGTNFLLADMNAYVVLAFSMAGSLMAFLLFNYPPAKIFMGDSGSLLLGLVNAILVIKFISMADSTSVPMAMPVSPVMGFAILSVPLCDTLRVFGLRIRNKKSPFAPDRNHIHHLLLDRGLNHRYVTLSCVGLNISLIAMAWFGRSLNATFLFCSLTAVSIGLVMALKYFIKPVSKVVNPTFQLNAEPLTATQPGRKIITIKAESSVKEAVAE